jgi:hypothetical protein
MLIVAAVFSNLRFNAEKKTAIVLHNTKFLDQLDSHKLFKRVLIQWSLSVRVSKHVSPLVLHLIAHFKFNLFHFVLAGISPYQLLNA